MKFKFVLVLMASSFVHSAAYAGMSVVDPNGLAEGYRVIDACVDDEGRKEQIRKNLSAISNSGMVVNNLKLLVLLQELKAACIWEREKHG